MSNQTGKFYRGLVLTAILTIAFVFLCVSSLCALEKEKPANTTKATESSYMPVAVNDSFEEIRDRKSKDKTEVINRQMALLAERYDLSDRPAIGVTMHRGKAIQAGIRTKLPP